jgi:hypothetical protein
MPRTITRPRASRPASHVIGGAISGPHHVFDETNPFIWRPSAKSSRPNPFSKAIRDPLPPSPNPYVSTNLPFSCPAGEGAGG